MIKKPSEEAKRRYAEYIQDYKNGILASLAREKTEREAMAREPATVPARKLSLAENNLDVVSLYLVMSSLSQTFLGVKNEAFLNDARKSLYKAIIYLEEIVSAAVDAPFSDYEQGLETISSFSDDSRLALVRKMGFTIDSLKEGYGEGTKWKWSFVELEGRFAAVAKNLLNLKTFVGGMDPRSEGYSSRMAHLALARELLQTAADRYREKYELSTLRLDDFKVALAFLGASRRLHIVLGEAEQADVVKKKADVWRTKMEADLKKSEARPRDLGRK